MSQTAIGGRAPTETQILYRVGGAMAVGGAALAFVGNAMHPRSTGYYGEPVEWMNHNTTSDIWFPSHLLILLGEIALVAVYVALNRVLADTRGRGMAQIGYANAVVGTALIIVTLAVDGLMIPELEDTWEVTTSPSPDAALVASVVYYTIFGLLYTFQITLFGLAPIFYGAGMILGGGFPRWFGPAGIVLGAAAAATGFVSMVGVASDFLDAVVWTFVAALVTVWLAAIGVLLWRAGARLDPAPPSLQ